MLLKFAGVGSRIFKFAGVGVGLFPSDSAVLELIDRFQSYLAQMVFTNVGMNWYCQIYQIGPVSHIKGGGKYSTKTKMC